MSPAGSRHDGVPRWLRGLPRAVRRHRRLLAAGLLAGSVALGMNAVAPPPPPSTPVLVAAHDLTAGQQLDAPDVATVRMDPGTVPDGALADEKDVHGRTVVSAVRRGEPLTDLRLVGPAAVDGLGPGLVAVPVRVADADEVRLVRPGDLVDVLAAGADGAGSSARLVASAVRVLTAPRTAANRFGGELGSGGLVVLATTSQTAARLAGAAVTERLSLILRGQ
ncbi:MAG TPA: Flp pilus assembly protein CpaB [Actinomycetes bacterium]|nr:Flp pilus assembly protein CpaB [Actinomycetes bacterium]